MAICHIASNQGDGVISAKEISDEYNIPNELLAKILQRLAKTGLIISQNGSKGGYLLAREPDQITVSQVVRAIEGPIGIMECYHDEKPQCEQLSLCTIRTPMMKVQQTVIDALDRMTLKEVSESMDPLRRHKTFDFEKEEVREETAEIVRL